MTDPLYWSIPLGRWSTTRIRVHIITLIFAVGRSAQAAISPGKPVAATLGWLALLALVVCLHEAARAFVSFRLGREPDDVQFWPLGNLIRPTSDSHSRENAMSAYAAIMTSGATAILSAIALSFLGARFVWNPFGNHAGGGAPLLVTGKQAADFTAAWWVGWFGFLNWVVFLLNLIPASPFDMGRVLRARLADPFGDNPRNSLIIPWIARGCAAVMILTALVRMAYDQTDQGFLLIALAILIELAVRHDASSLDEVDDDDFLGYDFSEGYSSLEGGSAKVRPYHESVIKRWRRRRSELRRARRSAREAAEEERLDEILAKLHVGGKAALTDEETRFLLRVSARLRGRSAKRDGFQ